MFKLRLRRVRNFSPGAAAPSPFADAVARRGADIEVGHVAAYKRRRAETCRIVPAAIPARYR